MKTITITCKWCGKTITVPAWGNGNRVTCGGYECQRKTKLDYLHRTGKSKPMGPRPCKYCGEAFIPKNRAANRRESCYKPECERARAQFYKKDIARRSALWRKQSREVSRFCTVCGRPLPENRYYRHDCCVGKVISRSDEKYLYMEEAW